MNTEEKELEDLIDTFVKHFNIIVWITLGVRYKTIYFKSRKNNILFSIKIRDRICSISCRQLDHNNGVTIINWTWWWNRRKTKFIQEIEMNFIKIYHLCFSKSKLILFN